MANMIKKRNVKRKHGRQYETYKNVLTSNVKIEVNNANSIK